MKNISLFLMVFLLIGCSKEQVLKLVHTSPLQPIFVSGSEGYACFRIPAIIQAPNGDLLAFSEGRKGGCSDTGDIDLVMRRSTDQGHSWGALELIWDDSSNTCGNPAPVVDWETGDIHLLSTWNLGVDRESQIIDQTSKDTRHVFVFRSSNNGKSWSKAREISSTTKPPHWTWYATGPGSGIQLKHPSHKGRLVIACDHIEAGSKKYYSHVIFSNDHGKTWLLGGTSPHDQVNECEVVELPDGQLLLNMRNYDRNQKQRQTAISKDGGTSWENQQHHPTLIEPICQASLQAYHHQSTNALLFSNPASTNKRVNMTVRISFDNGQSWPDSVLLHPAPSAYSDLVVLKDGTIGCLFESGQKNPYETIVFTQLKLTAVD